MIGLSESGLYKPVWFVAENGCAHQRKRVLMPKLHRLQWCLHLHRLQTQRLDYHQRRQHKWTKQKQQQLRLNGLLVWWGVIVSVLPDVLASPLLSLSRTKKKWSSSCLAANHWLFCVVVCVFHLNSISPSSLRSSGHVVCNGFSWNLNSYIYFVSL